jgi:hypothetical protein
MLEDLQRHQVSLQLRRESMRARVTTQLARDVASHQRRCYIEERDAMLAEAESAARLQAARCVPCSAGALFPPPPPHSLSDCARTLSPLSFSCVRDVRWWCARL